MKAAVVTAPNTSVVIEDRPSYSPTQSRRSSDQGACLWRLPQRSRGPAGTLPLRPLSASPRPRSRRGRRESGEGVAWPKVGDRVGMPWLFSSCGPCNLCTQGDEVMCPFVTVTGVDQDSGYQEYMIAPAHYVAPIPDGLGFADAGPLMCAGLTVFNGLRYARFKPGQKVAVIGLGGLGHLGILYAKAMSGRVAVISHSPDKEAEARELGAEYFVNTQANKAADKLQKWDGGADIILATAPSSQAVSDAFPGLAPDGTLVVLGVGAGEIQVSPMALVGVRRHLMGSPSGSRKDIRATLDFSASHHVLPRITKFPLEDAGKVLQMLHEGKIRNRAVLMFE